MLVAVVATVAPAIGGGRCNLLVRYVLLLEDETPSISGVPGWAHVVLGTRQGPLIMQGTLDNRPVVSLTFDPAVSGLEKSLAFPLLISNATSFLLTQSEIAAAPLNPPFDTAESDIAPRPAPTFETVANNNQTGGQRPCRVVAVAGGGGVDRAGPRVARLCEARMSQLVSVLRTLSLTQPSVLLALVLAVPLVLFAARSRLRLTSTPLRSAILFTRLSLATLVVLALAVPTLRPAGHGRAVVFAIEPLTASASTSSLGSGLGRERQRRAAAWQPLDT